MAIPLFQVLLVWLLSAPISADHDASVYYVVPYNSTTPCPCNPETCNSLNYYFQKAEQYFQSNTTIRFLKGTHILTNSSTIWIQRVENLTFMGDKALVPGQLGLLVPSSQIHCTQSAGFGFVSSQQLSIQNLLFSRCGGMLGFDGTVHAALALGNITDVSDFGSVINVTVSNIVVQNSTGYGII